jgi:hypothetical protein
MSSNRLIYDDCAYSLRTRRSTDPLKYQIYAGQVENCNECFSMYGARNGREDVSIARSQQELGFGGLAEVESELKNIALPAEECNTRGANQGYQKYMKNIVHKKMCNPFLESYDTRFTAPPITFRDVDKSQYNFNPYLPIDPQDNVVPDWIRWGWDTRLIVRDTYRTPNHSAWDCGEALPKARPDLDISCGVECKQRGGAPRDSQPETSS